MVVDRECQAKVDHLYVPIHRQHDVLGLQIVIDYADLIHQSGQEVDVIKGLSTSVEYWFRYSWSPLSALSLSLTYHLKLMTSQSNICRVLSSFCRLKRRMCNYFLRILTAHIKSPPHEFTSLCGFPSPASRNFIAAVIYPSQLYEKLLYQEDDTKLAILQSWLHRKLHSQYLRVNEERSRVDYKFQFRHPTPRLHSFLKTSHSGNSIEVETPPYLVMHVS